LPEVSILVAVLAGVALLSRPHLAPDGAGVQSRHCETDFLFFLAEQQDSRAGTLEHQKVPPCFLSGQQRASGRKMDVLP